MQIKRIAAKVSYAGSLIDQFSAASSRKRYAMCLAMLNKERCGSQTNRLFLTTSPLQYSVIHAMPHNISMFVTRDNWLCANAGPFVHLGALDSMREECVIPV